MSYISTCTYTYILLIAACPPDGNGLTLSDYTLVDNYYMYATPLKYNWNDAFTACTSLGLTLMDVNSEAKAMALMGSSFGDYNHD